MPKSSLSRIIIKEEKLHAKEKAKPNAKNINSIRPEHYFILASGKVIKDMQELALNLDGISDTDFYFHVTGQKNDFSSWLRDIFNEGKLAEELARLDNKKDSQILLLKHIVKKNEKIR
jgi:hypothetical protein